MYWIYDIVEDLRYTIHILIIHTAYDIVDDSKYVWTVFANNV